MTDKEVIAEWKSWHRQLINVLGVSVVERTATLQKAKQLVSQLAAKEQATKLMLALARHIWNPDNMSLHRWGVVGMDLLADVQKAFPAEYESQVKGTPNPAEHGEGT